MKDHKNRKRMGRLDLEELGHIEIFLSLGGR